MVFTEHIENVAFSGATNFIGVIFQGTDFVILKGV